ncbi:hypothetical protein L596_026666 [Steinernema carpocapsae]|uniref:Uncharacterized protein n=1 Tax=Steinernema carpocapsae TaxID=34508 RepID=A0A4U5M235_STECR|nr:hypothetical protein L596_026666 [Steinernema carpocapsae]
MPFSFSRHLRQTEPPLVVNLSLKMVPSKVVLILVFLTAFPAEIFSKIRLGYGPPPRRTQRHLEAIAARLKELPANPSYRSEIAGRPQISKFLDQSIIGIIPWFVPNHFRLYKDGQK